MGKSRLRFPGLTIGAWLIASAIAGPAAACECLWQGAFVDVLDSADLVVSGHVAARKGNAFDLDIDDVLRGREFRGRIRIWGDPSPAGYPAGDADPQPFQSAQPAGIAATGNHEPIRDADCRIDVAEFDPGSQWVMALQRIDRVPAGGFNPATPNISYGRVDDYALSRCGVYWLQRDGRFVSGNLLEARRWQYRGEPNPVVSYLLLADYLRGETDRQSLQQAILSPDRAKTRQLMEQTLDFLRQ